MSQSKKIIYVSYTYDKEHEELQHTIEEMFNEVVELPVEKRDYELPKKDNITMRLHSWRKVGDYYAGSLVMYTDGSMTTGEKESSSLEKFELPPRKENRASYFIPVFSVYKNILRFIQPSWC